ncbi:MAG: Asp23/Gls24 family envelope stress response protein [Deltaproteobacteria bacterium]
MAVKIKNDLGSLVINEAVIATIAGNAATKCAGIASSTAGANFWNRENLTKGIKVTGDNEKVIIDVSIVIEYGVKIAQVSESIMSAISNQVKEFTGLEVEKVNILVEGIKVDK